MSEPKPKHAKSYCLLHQIQQQRQGAERAKPPVATRHRPLGAALDASAKFPPLSDCGHHSPLALYNVVRRHPSRLMRWAKRGIGILGAVKMVRKALETR